MLLCLSWPCRQSLTNTRTDPFSVRYVMSASRAYEVRVLCAVRIRSGEIPGTHWFFRSTYEYSPSPCARLSQSRSVTDRSCDRRPLYLASTFNVLYSVQATNWLNSQRTNTRVQTLNVQKNVQRGRGFIVMHVVLVTTSPCCGLDKSGALCRVRI
jgi:hypothetical protein